ncbi:MAG: ferritin-like domain-containing protein [Phormidesmis sp.]
MNPTVAGLELPPLEPSHRLNKVLASALKEQSLAPIEIGIAPPWNASFFNLDTVPLFQSSMPLEQTQILALAGQSLLAESYFIEKAGVGYMAKMTLLAETTEERMLYALFSADEATHLAQLTPLVSQGDSLGTSDPFLRLLKSLLESDNRTVLLFVIQIVLEGWGLSHYRTLSKACCWPELSNLFRSFLQAEAKHHGVGVALFEPEALSAANQSAIVEAIAPFLQMIRVGPQRLVSAIASVKGELSRAQSVALLTDLETERHSGTRLGLLKQLMGSTAPTIVEALDQHNLFSPLPPARCVGGGVL